MPAEMRLSFNESSNSKRTGARARLPYFEQKNNDGDKMRDVAGQAEDVHCALLPPAGLLFY